MLSPVTHPTKIGLPSMKASELNFDGLVGPTHQHSGQSIGNLASTEHRGQISNPKEAALQSLQKMRLLLDLGIQQAVLPPHERPDIKTLRRLGFKGRDEEIIKSASKTAPDLLAAVSSAASMWTANSATVSPSADTADRKVHLTPANLCSQFHRSFEHETTSRIFRAIFHHDSYFVHHPALPPGEGMGDEGAANHNRFCETYEKPGVHLFVFGSHALGTPRLMPHRFPARQAYEASAAVARLHLLNPGSVVYAQQNPDAIDAGVFHNDVIGVGNQNILFFHEGAFLNPDSVLDELNLKYSRINDKELTLIKVGFDQLRIEDTVKSYLFNSQIINLPGGGMSIIAPVECQELPTVKNVLGDIVSDRDNPIESVHYVDLRQSMKNGGGPACLRLRVVLTDEEIAHTNRKIYLDPSLFTRLCGWVEKHYRDRLALEDLADPSLLSECRMALDELTQLLGLGSVYPFQLNG